MSEGKNGSGADKIVDLRHLGKAKGNDAITLDLVGCLMHHPEGSCYDFVLTLDSGGRTWQQEQHTHIPKRAAELMFKPEILANADAVAKSMKDQLRAESKIQVPAIIPPTDPANRS